MDFALYYWGDKSTPKLSQIVGASLPVLATSCRPLRRRSSRKAGSRSWIPNRPKPTIGTN